MTKRIAVLLAGCGCFDGSEIHESVLSLLAIKQQGADYQCFSIEDDQFQVTNHAINKVINDEHRNMLVESARIARGDIKAISTLDPIKYDALIIPGGFGVAHNLCNFALKQKDFTVRADVSALCQKFTELKKPVGFICIAPIMITKIYHDVCKRNKQVINMTLGNDVNIAQLVNNLGMNHFTTNVNEACVDHNYKIVTTPAYMLAKDITQVYLGVSELVKQVLMLC